MKTDKTTYLDWIKANDLMDEFEFFCFKSNNPLKTQRDDKRISHIVKNRVESLFQPFNKTMYIDEELDNIVSKCD